MMTAISTDFGPDRMTVNQLAKREHVHPASIWRWLLHGVRCHRLRSIRVGGRRFIRESDWQSFIEALNADLANAPAVLTPAAVTAHAEYAGAELDKLFSDDGSRRRKNANA